MCNVYSDFLEILITLEMNHHCHLIIFILLFKPIDDEENINYVSSIWMFKSWKMWRLVDIVTKLILKFGLPTLSMHGESIRSWILHCWLQDYMFLNQNYLLIIFKSFCYKWWRRMMSFILLLGSFFVIVFVSFAGF